MVNIFSKERETKNGITKTNILKYYINNGNSTITELSKELNLSIPTTTKLINEMCDDGYVREYGKLETSEGRRPNLYGVNPESGYFIGVDIKHTSVDVGLMNFKGELVDLQINEPYMYENTSQSLLELCGHVREYVQRLSIDKTKILSININVSGRVNPDTGYSYSIFNFSEEPLTKILSDEIGYPVYIDNDSHAMAYGEYMQGCVQGERNVLFVNASWGLGLGIIIDGRLYKGKSGFSGEIGHVHFFENEVLCHCGKKGCLETEASGVAFQRLVSEKIANGESSIVSEMEKVNGSYRLEDLIEATNREDMMCIEVVEQIGNTLGKAIAGFVNVFNPELVVIGGALSLTGDYLLQPIKTSMRKYSLNLVMRDTRICLSKLKKRAGVVGACMLARNHIFED